MSRAAAIARKAAFGIADCTRLAIVLTCAASLILAGQALPF